MILSATFSETPAENIKIVINIRDVTYDTRIFYSRLNLTFTREFQSHASIKDLWTQKKYSLS